MGKKIKEVDEYIANAEKFAQPVLKHLRKLVHQACPDVEEKIKWSFPCFDYKGMMAHMASFKAHIAFGFWKAKAMSDPHKLMETNERTGMGSFGRITSLDDLPDDKILIEYIKEAVRLNDEKVKTVQKSETKKAGEKKLIVPDYLTAALKKNKKAQATFENFSYSNKKEYVEWLVDAKTEATREKRLETTIEWLSEGKVRNWKYIKK